MEIWHHIGFGKVDNIDAELDSLQINYKRTPPDREAFNYVITFDILETDSRWPQVDVIVRWKHAVNLVYTTFTEDEIRAAEWSRLEPSFEQGYPQPEGTWVATQHNYRSFCRKCGADFVQVTPFRILKEPSMTRFDFMSLYWTHALFATPHVVELFDSAGARGYEVWDVLINKTKSPAQEIKQVYIPGVTAQGLEDVDSLRPMVCPQCGFTKYDYHKRGYMPYRRDALPAGVDIIQSCEWFGSGANAFREIFVSNKVATLILDHKLRGADLLPLVL